MKSPSVFRLAAVIAAGVAAIAAGGVRAAGPGELSAHDIADKSGQRMGGVRLPLKRYPANGRIKELLTADDATVDDAGLVHVAGVIRLVQFDENGATNFVAAGRNGFFDPRRNYAECHGPVAFVKPGVVLTGTNLTWNSKINTLRIETNAVLRIERGGRSAVDALAPQRR